MIWKLHGNTVSFKRILWTLTISVDNYVGKPRGEHARDAPLLPWLQIGRFLTAKGNTLFSQDDGFMWEAPSDGGSGSQFVPARVGEALASP